MVNLKDIQLLIDAVIDNTSLNYVSGHNSGVSDRYECSQCGAEVRCRDVNKNVTLNDLDHDKTCAYIIANRIQLP